MSTSTSRPATPAANAALSWFSRCLWIAIALQVIFSLVALFQPDLAQTVLGPGTTEFSYIWLANAGLLMLQAAIYFMPLSKDPRKYASYGWIAVAGYLLSAAFWWFENSRWGLVGPMNLFPWLGLGLGLLLLILLQVGLPEELRLSFRSVGRFFGGLFGKLAETLEGTPGNAALTWFSRLTLVGFVVNMGFILPSIAAPEWMVGMLYSTDAKLNYIWLGFAGFTLLVATLLYLPAAHKPLTYTVYAWLSVLGRGMAAVFWIAMDVQWKPTGPLKTFFLTDGLFCILFLVLLLRGMPVESRPSFATFRRWFAGILGDIRRALSSPVTLIFTLLVAGGLAYVGSGLYKYLVKAEPDVTFDDPVEQYKYGAIGLAQASRVPLYIWNVAPELCPDLLPEHGRGGDAKKGWASLGMLYEAGKDLPVGFARRQIGYPAVEPNCALCHTGSYKTSAEGESQLILGGSAHELDLESFQWFLYDCAASDAFTPKNVLAAIERQEELAWFEKQVYRFAIIPFAKTGLAQQKQGYAWQKSRPPQGRGRTDTFNPTKFTVFYMPDDGTIGTVDLPVIWNQKPRESLWLHWDGNNGDIHERNYAAAMAIGATPFSVLEDHFKRVTDYVLELPPPEFPFAVDTEKAEQGWALYQAHCADCHQFGAAKVGTVTNIEEIGTDRHRLDSFTAELVTKFHSVDEGLFKFDAYRKTDGYSNLPLDGVWARAPYLHNGSAPDLWQLLTPPAERVTEFYRGYPVYDPVKMGFIHQGALAREVGFHQQASVAGNGNTGHAYGTELADDEKWALIEYLKTL